MEKQEDDLHHSHDKLFKTAFQIKSTVVDFLLNFFPKDLIPLIDLDTLELDTTNYITSVLEEYHSDVVYRTKLNGKEARLILLFEHKTKISRAIFVQLLEYMIAMWKQDLAAKKPSRPFTIIIPIVVFQGQAGFKYKSFYEYFPDLPAELRQFVPQFEYVLSNIKKIGDTHILDLKDESLLRALFLAFKHTRDTNYVTANFIEFLKFYLKNPELKDFLNQILLYLYHNSDITKEILNDLYENLPSPIKDSTMTTYARIKEEGKIEAKLEASRKFVLNLLELSDYDVETVARLADVSLDFVLEIKKELEKNQNRGA